MSAIGARVFVDVIKPHPSKTRSKRVFLWRLTSIAQDVILETS